MKRLIDSGVQRSEKLPSVPDLAKSLAANPGTVKAAYLELARQGYLPPLEGLIPEFAE